MSTKIVNRMVPEMTNETQGAVETAIPRIFRVLDSRWDGRSTLSVEEAGCDVLGLSRAAAYMAAKSGALPIVRVGRRMVVPRYALEKLLLSAS
jgi:excisionase family DNA binding protein